MAIRNIRIDGDDILKKKSKEVKYVDDKTKELIEDMKETMKSAEGVGLAAPQIGLLKRIIVVDNDGDIFGLVNPEIVESEGEQTGEEGCLSVPTIIAEVKRPFKVKVKALNEEGAETVIDAEGFFARILCHEIDHLDGYIIKDRAISTRPNE